MGWKNWNMRIIRSGENECWRWDGGHRNGYACVWADGKWGHASRHIWQKVHGAITPGFHVDHKCNNNWCVNVAHFQLAIARDNIKNKVNLVDLIDYINQKE